MTTEETRALINTYIAAYNAFDADRMLSVVHAEVEFRNVSGERTTASASGIEELRQMAER